jgi:pyruvate,water dikinase
LKNPVHAESGAGTRWTTVNFAEGVEGTQTPLSWDVWGRGIEGSMRRCFRSFGLDGVSESIPMDVDRRFAAAFYGRAAANLTVIREIADQLPGTSGDVLEEKLFGTPAGPAQRKAFPIYTRYPHILRRMPAAVWRAPAELSRTLAEYRGWWQAVTLDRPPKRLSAAQALYIEAAERFVRVGLHHTAVSFVGPELMERLTALGAQATGDPYLGQQLCAGHGGMEETQIIEDLWATANGKLRLESFRRRHGFHGPAESRLETRSWREDLRPVEAILERYSTNGVENPREREHERSAARADAERRTLQGLPRRLRPMALGVMKAAAIMIPAREQGKAAYLHAVDAARCAARAGGVALADDGVLERPDDVFFLTGQEFTTGPAVDLKGRIAERRSAHERYLAITIPSMFTGSPEPIRLASGPTATGIRRVTGIGVAGGVVSGRARVVSDPAQIDLEDGDILVCSTTDPSWTPLFMLVDAIVIDTGGQMSHGAIVARELGVTCVINTASGTRDIPDGAAIRVDGARGTVDILGP